MDGAALIAAERLRQIEQEGWTPEHDDQHVRGEMGMAGAVYAFYAADLLLEEFLPEMGDEGTISHLWPWDAEWWKPSISSSATETDAPIRNLVKAGALIAAEIDRLQRRG